MSDQNQSEQSKSAQEQGDLDPYEINFLPQFEQGRGPHQPFVNEHGVVIGDHVYESENSPLVQWTENTDPFVMAGDKWVHPYKDIGFQTAENRNIFEKGIPPQGGTFMHPDKDVAYEYDLGQSDPGRAAIDKPKDEAEA
ncbi:DUF3905 domain-containing protein [Paenibacillus sedimenti]|uniref:DUF3905 domain-containing protein n=1 Tax=Paenibacillus sedimenti TaxID=2770274 RepID=A0A926QK27_9BACL|nr:DUF3905 domain-containing protein [Paenibacillus sedimenti]MBD0382361.1 DUF3905 domain-containing protein [Paenibacillus sedimenti]